MLLIIMLTIFATVGAGVAVYCLLKDYCWESFICIMFSVVLIGIIAILDKVGA